MDYGKGDGCHFYDEVTQAQDYESGLASRPPPLLVLMPLLSCREKPTWQGTEGGLQQGTVWNQLPSVLGSKSFPG